MNELSPVTLGTMRFLDKGLSVADVEKLLDFSYHQGITSLHLSPEYASYELVKSARRKNEHAFMVKIPAPHFDEESFNKRALFKRVDDFLTDFKINCIDVAQWMWRTTPLDEDKRIERTRESLNEMRRAFDALLASGKVRAFSCFPYTARYMHFVDEMQLIKSQTNYLNFWEDDLYQGGISENSIVLRPLASGRFRSLPVAGEKKQLSYCINYALSHPHIQSAVISMHDRVQVKEVADMASAVQKSEVVFRSYREMIQ